MLQFLQVVSELILVASHTHTFSTVGFGELRVDEAAKLPGKLRSQMETLFLFPLLELSGVKCLLVPSLLSIFYAFAACSVRLLPFHQDHL